jgi:hypothetical protein
MRDEEKFLVECRQLGLGDAMAEYAFHETRRWRFDYAFSRRIAIEIDGDAHAHPGKRMRDAEKRNAAQAMGWIVLVLTERQLKNRTWRDAAADALAFRRAYPLTVPIDYLGDADSLREYADAERQMRMPEPSF